MAADSPRPESPLTAGELPSHSTKYILHPPLPAVNPTVQGTVPLLLNPEIMQGTPIPIISPQVKWWLLPFIQYCSSIWLYWNLLELSMKYRVGNTRLHE